MDTPTTIAEAELYLITLSHAQYLGMSASVAGGWVATSPVARDAVERATGHDLLLARLHCAPDADEGRPVKAREIAAIRECLERLATPSGHACLRGEERQAARTLAMLAGALDA